MYEVKQFQEWIRLLTYRLVAGVLLKVVPLLSDELSVCATTKSIHKNSFSGTLCSRFATWSLMFGISPNLFPFKAFFNLGNRKVAGCKVSGISRLVMF